MSDDEKRELTPANENPWYWLATVHGEQAEGVDWWNYDRDLAAKNRMAWNRWMASALSDDERAELISKGFDTSELAPLLDEERTEFLKEFVARANREDATPPKPTEVVDFPLVRFESAVFFSGFVFPHNTSFVMAAFSGHADFCEAAFAGGATFYGAAFSGFAFFNAFSGSASFCEASFCGDAVFNRATFSGFAVFENARFSADAYFKEAAFPGDAAFGKAMFSRIASFDEARFSGNASFCEAAFSGNANFSKAIFSGDADFRKAAFSGDAHFNKAAFAGDTNFSKAEFSGVAFFVKAAFSGDAHFVVTRFSGFASFDEATYSSDAEFDEATFSDDADFMAAEFKSLTRFAGAKFQTAVPDFRDAKLSEATEWHGATWPPSPKDREAAQQQVYAYERLKAEMERLKKHADEQFFFAKELRARRALETRGSLQWLLNYAYEISSDYGQSVGWPIFWLVVLFALGADFFALAPVYHNAPLPYHIAEGLSATNLFPLLPYKPKLEELSAAAQIIGDLQSVLGLILLFLLGLALRNLFRMK